MTLATLNQFGYGVNSPVTYDDPTGMCPPNFDCPPPSTLTKKAQDHWLDYQRDHAALVPAPQPAPAPAPCHSRCGVTPAGFVPDPNMYQDTDPGCGFLGWRCVDDVAGATWRGTATVLQNGGHAVGTVAGFVSSGARLCASVSGLPILR